MASVNDQRLNYGRVTLSTDDGVHLMEEFCHVFGRRHRVARVTLDTDSYLSPPQFPSVSPGVQGHSRGGWLSQGLGQPAAVASA